MDKGKIVDHYLMAVLWTSEMDGDFEISDVDADSRQQAAVDIHYFLEKAGNLLDGWCDEQIGHDFWLTRNGHGTGFWDRDLPNGKELTKICHSMRYNGEVFEADGVIYL